VLIVCYFFPPLAGGGVHRVLSFVQHLPAHGWDCTVVCAGEHDYWVTDASLEARVPDATEVIRVTGGSALSALLRVTRAAPGKRSGRTFGSLRRLSDWWLLPDSYVGWARRAQGVASRRIAQGGIDVVLSSSPPDSVHLAARALQRRHHLPWVADFRDPWIGLTFRTPPSAWHRARQAALERDVLEHADLVQVASLTHQRSLGAASSARVETARVAHLPNGWEAESPVPPEPPAGASAERFTLVYTGTLSQMPDTEVFLEAVHEVLKRQPAARRTLRARLAGPYESWYADRAVALGLTGIVDFPGPVSHLESRSLQRSADVLMLWKPRDVPTMVPGKLYEYLETGRPIVAVLDAEDEAAELARRGGGSLTPPGNREALSAEIERRWLAWRDGVRAPAVRPPWLDEYRRDHLAGRLAATLTRATESRR
jgi:glycosyltransferase involved in cell wall biosynthesis